MRAICGSATIMWLLVGCGTDQATGTKEEKPALEIESTDLVIHPGEETTKCFYFHTGNADRLTIHKWVSDMTPGSHHMIYFANLGMQPADGTLDECNLSGAVPLPMYGTQIEHQELDFPLDDTGIQLAQQLNAGAAGFFQMHYVNSSDGDLTVHVKLTAYALDDKTPFTRTDLFATYNNDIAIPPGATGYKVAATCPTDPNQMADLKTAKFWQMSTHSHKQSVTTSISDGASLVLTSGDWEHPTIENFDAPDFFSFSSGQMTWECDYDNTGANKNNTITAGQSAQTNEMCMATGYYYPVIGAFGPNGCVINNGECNCPVL